MLLLPTVFDFTIVTSRSVLTLDLGCDETSQELGKPGCHDSLLRDCGIVLHCLDSTETTPRLAIAA